MSVESEYRARIGAMSAAERVRRAEALVRWSRDFLVRAILAERGPMSAARLRRELALRLYGSDPTARRLIEELPARALE